jgi:hypothetical protein
MAFAIGEVYFAVVNMRRRAVVLAFLNRLDIDWKAHFSTTRCQLDLRLLVGDKIEITTHLGVLVFIFLDGDVDSCLIGRILASAVFSGSVTLATNGELVISSVSVPVV